MGAELPWRAVSKRSLLFAFVAGLVKRGRLPSEGLWRPTICRLLVDSARTICLFAACFCVVGVRDVKFLANELCRGLAFFMPFQVGPSNRFVGGEDNGDVFQRSQTVQMRACRVGSNPNERHSHVVVPKGAIQLDDGVLDRWALYLLLHTPFFSFGVERWVEVNGVKFVNEVVGAFVGCRLRFISRELLPSRRPHRSVCVVKRVRYVVPQVAFVGSKAKFGIFAFFQVRKEVGDSIEGCKAGHTGLFAMVVFVSW